MTPALLVQTTTQDEGIEMCSVRVGQTLYGVPVTRVLEILGRPAKQPVPLAPRYIGVLCTIAGKC